MKEMGIITAVGDWGSYADSLDGEPLDAGEQIIIQWPDGHLQQITVAIELEHGTVSDHGHVSSTTSKHAFFNVDYRGMSVKIPLEGLPAQRVKPKKKGFGHE